MMKCSEVKNDHGNRIKKADKSDTTVVCPSCGADEDWEHVMLCEKSEENRE